MFPLITEPPTWGLPWKPASAKTATHFHLSLSLSPPLSLTVVSEVSSDGGTTKSAGLAGPVGRRLRVLTCLRKARTTMGLGERRAFTIRTRFYTRARYERRSCSSVHVKGGAGKERGWNSDSPPPTFSDQS